MPEISSSEMNETLAVAALELAFYVSGFGQKCCYLHTERRDRIEALMARLLPLLSGSVGDFDRVAAVAIDQHLVPSEHGAMTMFLARLKHLSQYSDGALLSTELIGDSYFDKPA